MIVLIFAGCCVVGFVFGRIVTRALENLGILA
jgi:hypothetical protein